MQYALKRTLIFVVVLILFELALSYYQSYSNGLAYEFSTGKMVLIPIFAIGYFLIQLFKYKKLNQGN